MIPNKFLYNELEFIRRPELEFKTLIYINHIWVAKWDVGFNEYKNLYSFINNDCDPKDRKYFVDTKRIKVKGISGYGYLQPKLDIGYIDSNDWDNLIHDKVSKIVNRLLKKYPIEDFYYGHNIGFQNGEMKIFDLVLV